jgi:hypothetical protein
MKGHGTYRTRGIYRTLSTVRVVNKIISFDAPEKITTQRRYNPDLDELPWIDAPPQVRKEATSRRNSRRSGAE